jgi:hypothetical protein
MRRRRAVSPAPSARLLLEWSPPDHLWTGGKSRQFLLSQQPPGSRPPSVRNSGEPCSGQMSCLLEAKHFAAAVAVDTNRDDHRDRQPFVHRGAS